MIRFSTCAGGCAKAEKKMIETELVVVRNDDIER